MKKTTPENVQQASKILTLKISLKLF